MTYLFDTSAWLAHLFGEPGVDEIMQVFDDPASEVSVSVLSLLEVHGRLKALGKQDQWPTINKIYSALFVRALPIDERVAQIGIEVRSATTPRLPVIDALIAATAVVHQLVLVHRDPHIAAIADSRLRQLILSDKS